MKSEYQNTSAFDFLLLQNTVGIEWKCSSFMNRVALLPWFRDRHFDGFVSSNVRYVTCSHRTDCHAELPAGRVHCLKMAKIDPVSPFYPTLWLKKPTLQWGNLQKSTKKEPLGCKYLLLCVSKLEVFTQLQPAYHENSWTLMVSYRDFLQKPRPIPWYVLNECLIVWFK